ncbi:MAG: phenylalanine--tRNA ligase subunit alpha [Omnitrophica WOR_2 bacterium SM23_29]|nr:MAG: phenylalanine--tRNA ligase subunit alpha [Omnitrophica WOR_2 bacterium SM23_29]
MLNKIKSTESEAGNEISKASDLDALDNLRIKYLGRRGLIAELFKQVATTPDEDRPKVGFEVNSLKGKIEKLLNEKQSELLEKSFLSEEVVDLTLPGFKPPIGTKHPIIKTIDKICEIFLGLGFKIVEGPEVETEFYNFEALNIPLDHPSRDMFDTFYIKGEYLLRSHTSPVQIRFMENEKPPFKIVVPGKVYRPDAVDASHSFMFHQIEGLVVGDDVTFADLKGTLKIFIKEYFGEKVKMRFRPHYFPFTEPSAEVDISCIICGGLGCSVCGRKGWLEILGCGMVHPNVFRTVKYNSEKVTGYAFGMGVERIAMLKYGISDIRLFFENDMRFLGQFK